ncbi:hypothetical protein M422DRAFT_272016 [Sphaerobolus stellatus SS14]|uniref:Uncharacterized protein n=1 Tax=Sphaerobolus stellatus (strain SS14) TaxID=990650 RepID=A0A0C9UN25_SPHS4|nr:hypothetical protein M422DRAFT_272016 [Sphaerobolus stellatus SS14]
MDNEPNTQMQVDSSTHPMSAIQAFKLDPSNEWVIESIPGFVAIKHKMGCTICDASASHCMAAKRSYEIRLAEEDVSHAVAEAWPELVRYRDDYHRLLEDYNVLKETLKSAEALAEERRAKMSQLYDRLDSRRVTIQNLTDQDAAWAEKNGYRITDIPASDDEDDDDDPTGLPTITEDIPQYIPVVPNARARITSKKFRNDFQVVREAGIPAIGGYRPPPKQKRIVADPPASITGVLPKPLGKTRAERWDQPAFRGCSEWILEQDVHDIEMRRLYVEAKALPPHQRAPDHTTVMFRIDENLVIRHDDPDWMADVIQSFNSNPSGVPRNLRLEGLHVNVDDADVWYWVNLIKPKYRGADTENMLHHIFSSIGRWEKLVSGQWKRNDSLFLCSPTPARFEIPRKQKLDGQRDCLVEGKPHEQFLMEEPMDQDEADPEPVQIQQAGSVSLADRLDYGEGGSFSKPPSDAHELRARVSYFDSLVPQGTACASTAELTEELTRDLYAENLE